MRYLFTVLALVFLFSCSEDGSRTVSMETKVKKELNFTPAGAVWTFSDTDGNVDADIYSTGTTTSENRTYNNYSVNFSTEASVSVSVENSVIYINSISSGDTFSTMLLSPVEINLNAETGKAETASLLGTATVNIPVLGEQTVPLNNNVNYTVLSKNATIHTSAGTFYNATQVKLSVEIMSYSVDVSFWYSDMFGIISLSASGLQNMNIELASIIDDTVIENGCRNISYFGTITSADSPIVLSLKDREDIESFDSIYYLIEGRTIDELSLKYVAPFPLNILTETEEKELADSETSYLIPDENGNGYTVYSALLKNFTAAPEITLSIDEDAEKGVRTAARIVYKVK